MCDGRKLFLRGRFNKARNKINNAAVMFCPIISDIIKRRYYGRLNVQVGQKYLFGTSQQQVNRN
jgi:hypothetical protein